MSEPQLYPQPPPAPEISRDAAQEEELVSTCGVYYPPGHPRHSPRSGADRLRKDMNAMNNGANFADDPMNFCLFGGMPRPDVGYRPDVSLLFCPPPPDPTQGGGLRNNNTRAEPPSSGTFVQPTPPSSERRSSSQSSLQKDYTIEPSPPISRTDERDESSNLTSKPERNEKHSSRSKRAILRRIFCFGE